MKVALSLSFYDESIKVLFHYHNPPLLQVTKVPSLVGLMQPALILCGVIFYLLCNHNQPCSLRSKAKQCAMRNTCFQIIPTKAVPSGTQTFVKVTQEEKASDLSKLHHSNPRGV